MGRQSVDAFALEVSWQRVLGLFVAYDGERERERERERFKLRPLRIRQADRVNLG